jgi:hypothetical protein
VSILQIREDTKTGVYVESLTEEYVSSMGDVAHLLVRVREAFLKPPKNFLY